MFFDKLWVRIKGDLLIMTDDLAAGENLRERAAILLGRLEDLLKSKESEEGEGTQKEHDAEESAEDKMETTGAVTATDTNHAALQRIHREWEELMKLRKEGQEDSEDSQIHPPNPRRLG